MRTALVLGGAACVFDDVDRALDLGEYQGLTGANLIGIHWRGAFDGFVSLHPDRFKLWNERRRRAGLPAHKAMFGLGQVEHRFPGQTKPGSSGLFALKVALDDLGFDRAVLCGIPQDPEAAHFDDPKDWTIALTYREAWVQALPHIADRARSMSGWTMATLGGPTPAWIAGD